MFLSVIFFTDTKFTKLTKVKPTLIDSFGRLGPKIHPHCVGPLGPLCVPVSVRSIGPMFVKRLFIGLFSWTSNFIAYTRRILRQSSLQVRPMLEDCVVIIMTHLH